MTCGTCRYYEPTRNPKTGRILISEGGQCAYPVQWPTLPIAFCPGYLYEPRYPYRHGVSASKGANCPVREDKPHYQTNSTQ